MQGRLLCNTSALFSIRAWMDIEGYEGHALQGAPNLLAAGVPVVCEYNSDYLMRSGGMKLFRQALAGYRIFDLKQGAQANEIGWDALTTRYSMKGDFTDVLAIPAHIGSPI